MTLLGSLISLASLILTVILTLITIQLYLLLQESQMNSGIQSFLLSSNNSLLLFVLEPIVSGYFVLSSIYSLTQLMTIIYSSKLFSNLPLGLSIYSAYTSRSKVIEKCLNQVSEQFLVGVDEKYGHRACIDDFNGQLLYLSMVWFLTLFSQLSSVIFIKHYIDLKRVRNNPSLTEETKI